MEHGITVVPSWRHEVKCARVDFQAPFLQPPYVMVTLNHRLAPSQPAHAPASTWVEGVHKAGFRVCLAGSDVPTDDIQLDWLAFDRASAASAFYCAFPRTAHCHHSSPHLAHHHHHHHQATRSVWSMARRIWLMSRRICPHARC